MTYRLIVALCAAVCGAGCTAQSSPNSDCPDAWGRFIQTLEGSGTGACTAVPEGTNSFGDTDLSISDACSTCLTAHCASAARACYLATDAGAECGPPDPAYAALSSCITASCASSCPDGAP